MASQPSDRLKTILAEARAKAEAARNASPAAAPGGETRRVEALLDRSEALPDSRALSRLYREQSLVERLPEDDDHPVAAETPSAPAAPEDVQDGGRQLYTPPATRVPAADRPPAHPSLSAAQVREIMNELRHQFTPDEYATYESKPLPEEVIPLADEPQDDEAAAVAEPREFFYVIGAIVAVILIGGFILLALGGPLRYSPPAGASPSPTATSKK